jgi:hypothetical protein
MLRIMSNQTNSNFEINNASILEDKRSTCLSVMTSMKVSDYFSLISHAYQNKGKNGNLDFQREPLKTKSAISIRKRMIEDIKLGAVLPPMVIGLVVKEAEFKTLSSLDTSKFQDFLSAHYKNVNEPTKDITEELNKGISIIDGMQRTTAILEAQETQVNVLQNVVRVEFWVATKINNLIYRMLVLNTGQIPWNLRRQIEVVYKPLVTLIKDSVADISMLSVDDNQRRVTGGQFRTDDVIELYIVFGSRKESIVIKEMLAEELNRLDFIESVATQDYTDKFIFILNQLGLIDKQFGKFNNNNDENNKEKFSNGKDLFSSQPAKVGFMTAMAKKIYGRPGIDLPIEKKEANLKSVQTGLNNFVDSITKLSGEQIGVFLNFETLNEAISKKTTKVGLFEREFFLKAFETLIDENFNLDNLGSCWQAY